MREVAPWGSERELIKLLTRGIKSWQKLGRKTFLACPLLLPPYSPVFCPSPPVLPLFCLVTGGCQSGFMSSSLELKEVSFVSCYGTRRLCLSGVMRSGLGEQGEQGEGPSPAGDQQWGSQSGFYVAADGCLFGNYPPLHEQSFSGEIPAKLQRAHGRVHNTPSTKINFSQQHTDAWLKKTQQIHETCSCVTWTWWTDLLFLTVAVIKTPVESCAETPVKLSESATPPLHSFTFKYSDQLHVEILQYK